MSHLKVVNRIPFEEIMFCGNRIYQTAKLIEIKGVEPIVLANGIRPRVWLTVFLDNGDTFCLVDDSKAKHDSVSVDLTTNHIKIYVDNHVILQGTKPRQDKLTIDHLDLRSLGLDIYGDSETLYFAGSSMSNSCVKGSGCLLHLG